MSTRTSIPSLRFITIGQHHSLQTICATTATTDDTQVHHLSEKSIPDCFFSDVPLNFVVDHSTHTVNCAHLDTGAWASVTPFQHLMHDYK